MIDVRTVAEIRQAEEAAFAVLPDGSSGYADDKSETGDRVIRYRQSVGGMGWLLLLEYGIAASTDQRDSSPPRATYQLGFHVVSPQQSSATQPR